MAFESLLCQRLACVECKAPESIYWHHGEKGAMCDACYRERKERTVRWSQSQETLSAASKAEQSQATDASTAVPGRAVNSSLTRKSNRLKPLGKSKLWQNVAKPAPTKGRSRRYIFKKSAAKTPLSVSSVVTSEHVFYEGSYWQVGDVVSVIDTDDGETYFAQLRGFLEDEYCQKSALINWLIPRTDLSRQTAFSPSLYIAGPEEDLPRDMSHFQFICHAPSDYFKATSLYKTHPVTAPPIGCFWTSFGLNIAALESQKMTENEQLMEKGDKNSGKLDASQKHEEFEKKSAREKTRSHKAAVTRIRDRLAK